MAEKITKRADDYSQWYLDIVQRAGLAENSDVRGCMVIKPNGYAIWEKMQRALDRMFKDTGHVNAYFPLFIPKSFLAREEAIKLLENKKLDRVRSTNKGTDIGPSKSLTTMKNGTEQVISPTQDVPDELSSSYRTFTQKRNQQPQQPRR